MEIEVPDFRVRAMARLYDEYAPKTIGARATVLPFTGPVFMQSERGGKCLRLSQMSSFIGADA